MATATFYPDGNVETNSVDGHAQELTDAIWATIRDDVGDGASSTATEVVVSVATHASTSPQYTDFQRGIFLFDTASLGEGAGIESATFQFIGDGNKLDDFAESGSISLVLSAPASPTDVVAGDFDSLGTVKQATDVTIDNVTDDGSTYDSFTLNVAGLLSINKNGITKFGVRVTFDNDDDEPTWAADKRARVQIMSADNGDDAKRPKLVVVYTPADESQAVIDSSNLAARSDEAVQIHIGVIG